MEVEDINKLTGIARRNANLKMFNSETARAAQKNSSKAQKANFEKIREFKELAKRYKSVLKDLPELSSLDVIRLTMMLSLQNEDMDDAARYAGMLAEYEKPKLQRIDQTTTQRFTDMSDEEFAEVVKKEGLV